MRLLPEASTYVVFELAGRLAGSAYMVGTLLRPVLVELRGEVDRVGIRFRPGIWPRRPKPPGCSARSPAERVRGTWRR